MRPNDRIARRLLRTALLAALLVACAALVARRAAADQPHMEAALEHLKAAEAELKEAAPDKGGHRAKAMGLVRDAIVQVEKGIQFARAH